MSRSNDAHQVGIAIGKLIDRLTRVQDDLRRMESSAGTGQNLRRMIKCREEIESLERRIATAEAIQDGLLSS